MSTPAACIYDGGMGYWHEKLVMTAFHMIFTIRYSNVKEQKSVIFLPFHQIFIRLKKEKVLLRRSVVYFFSSF